MEDYEILFFEVIRFETVDVITSSVEYEETEDED